MLRTVQERPIMIQNNVANTQPVNLSKYQLFTIKDHPRTGEISVKARPEAFLAYLRDNGFQKIFPNHQNKEKALLVRIIDHVVTPVTIEQTQNFLYTSMRNTFPENGEQTIFFFDEWHKQAKKIINDTTLNSLNEFFVPEWEKDTRDEAKFFFQNGVVQVTKEGISSCPYSKMLGYIWESQKINRPVDPMIRKNFSGFPFGKFLQNVCTNPETMEFDEARHNSLLSTLGYLLHAYKNPAYAKAIVFTESNLDTTVSNGGTGKGLITKAIGELRRKESEDGRVFDPKNTFAYQKLSLDTKVYEIEDASKNFDYETLYNKITGDLDYERKHQPRQTIKFADSPKIVVTTNYTVTSTGSSTDRRKFEMELYTYYNNHNTPIDEFGKLFFDEWDHSEWNEFYSLMFYSVQQFLKNGSKIPEYSSDTLLQRKLLFGIGKELTEYFDNLTPGTAYSTNEELQKYLTEVGSSTLKSKGFTTCLSKWAALRNCHVEFKRAYLNGTQQRCFIIQSKDNRITDQKHHGTTEYNRREPEPQEVQITNKQLSSKSNEPLHDTIIENNQETTSTSNENPQMSITQNNKNNSQITQHPTPPNPITQNLEQDRCKTDNSSNKTDTRQINSQQDRYKTDTRQIQDR